jgi:hypothetical protein
MLDRQRFEPDVPALQQDRLAQRYWPVATRSMERPPVVSESGFLMRVRT